MTILAIMSIVLALCGATVTGIKECRAALAERVQNIVSAAKEAFDTIDKRSGDVSQDNCPSDATKCSKQEVHRNAKKAQKSFYRAHWRYEKTIWIPISLLLLIALGLTVRLSVIAPSEFKNVVTNPSDGEVKTFQRVLIYTSLLNALAGGLMTANFFLMRWRGNSLKNTATTLKAGEVGQQMKAADTPESVLPKPRTALMLTIEGMADRQLAAEVDAPTTAVE